MSFLSNLETLIGQTALVGVGKRSNGMCTVLGFVGTKTFLYNPDLPVVIIV
jgi:hypothetical protein